MVIKNNKFLIIGSGITGLTLAAMLVKNGASKVKIIEKNSHIGGNCYDYKDKNGFLIHKYGPHIFHTNEEYIFNFLKEYTDFDTFIHHVLVKYEDELIPFPINSESILKITNNKNIINELKNIFKENNLISIRQLLDIPNDSIKKLGEDIYKNIYENYTMKMWNISAADIDLNVLNRVKINLTDEWNYFPMDKFVGIPKNGWTTMMQNMCNDNKIEILCNTNYKDMYKIDNLLNLLNYKVYDAIFYTGMIDELFNYEFGKLPYRSLHFEFDYLPNIDYFQPTSVVNYPADPRLTRITEYKKLTNQFNLKGTVIGKEYPGAYDYNSKIFNTPYYPINDINNLKIFNKYYEKIKKYHNFFCLGRLGQYRYFDTDDAIKNAMDIISELINKN